MSYTDYPLVDAETHESIAKFNRVAAVLGGATAAYAGVDPALVLAAVAFVWVVSLGLDVEANKFRLEAVQAGEER